MLSTQEFGRPVNIGTDRLLEIPGSQSFGPGSEFGFKNPLAFFNLLRPTPQTDPNSVRHTVGFGYNAPRHQRNLLSFFSLLSKFGTLPASHNRQVEGSSPSGPTILIDFYRFFINLAIRLFRGHG
jgi:hypothetical protein